MILERLAVEGFRHLAAPYEFLPDERVTIVSAPNGTGKSTLLDALYYGLLEKHTVTGTVAAERFASRGRDLVPRIAIDFRVGAVRYRLRKQFLRDKRSKLERWDSGRFVALKEGAASDDFVRELFAAEAPVRGALDAAKHWGLAHILWSPGGVRYSAVPSTAGDQVRSMLSDIAMPTLGERAVEAHVADRYQHYFTETGALARSAGSANIPARDAAIAAAKSAVIEATAAITRLDELRRSHAHSSREAQRIAAVRVGIRSELEVAKKTALAFDRLGAQRQAYAVAQERWRAEFGNLKYRTDAIAELQAKRTAHAVFGAQTKIEIDALADRLATLGARRQSAAYAVDAAAAASALVQGRAAEITAAQTYATVLTTRRMLQERIALTDDDLERIAELRKQRTAIVAPTKAEVARLRDIAAERRSLEATIAALSLKLTFTAEADVAVDVVNGDCPGSVGLRAGIGETIVGADEIIVNIPGFGQVTASGADSAANARRKHATLTARLDTAFRRFSATSIVELERRTERAAEIDAHLALCQRVLAERLRGDEPAVDRTRLLEVQTRADAILREYPAWHDKQPDAAALRATFDVNLNRTAEAENDARQRLRAAQDHHAVTRSELDLLVANERERANADRGHAMRLNELQADGLDDAQRNAQLLALSLEWNAARAGREQIESRLHAFAQNPHDVRALLEAQEFDASEQFEHCHGLAQRDLALLEEVAQHGSYHRLAQAEETLQMLIEEQRVARTEAQAIHLLWNSFSDIRKQRLDAVLAPVEAGASRYLARMAGTSLGSVYVAPDLTPRGIHQHDTDMLLEIQSTLSAGEREQIYIATRFAIADVIAGARGRQLFVLDDVLTATDPGRLRRFVMLLEELSRERLQVIVTTTDASRYADIAAAKHIDLRAALAVAAAA